MPVERIDLWQVALPLRVPYVTAGSSLTERRVVIVRVTAGEVVGWGEAAPVPGYSAATVDEVWEALAAAPETTPPVTLPGEARAALSGARADLAARAAGQPLWRALGGTGPAVPAGAVAGLHREPGDLVAEVDRYVGEGYRAVKVKIAPGADREQLAAVRRHHPDLVLGADGNGSYRRGDIEQLARFADLGLAYLEQPLPADDLDGHGRLAAATPVPICLDESIGSAADVARAAALGAAALVNVKPGRLGGLRECREVLAAAQRAGLGARAGGMLETGIGRAHLVALASLPGFTVAGDVAASDRYFVRDVVTPPWQLTDGCLVAPETPGIGVAVDEAALDARAERTATSG